jgi:hypothetical protein
MVSPRLRSIIIIIHICSLIIFFQMTFGDSSRDLRSQIVREDESVMIPAQSIITDTSFIDGEACNPLDTDDLESLLSSSPSAINAAEVIVTPSNTVSVTDTTTSNIRTVPLHDYSELLPTSLSRQVTEVLGIELENDDGKLKSNEYNRLAYSIELPNSELTEHSNVVSALDTNASRKGPNTIFESKLRQCSEISSDENQFAANNEKLTTSNDDSNNEGYAAPPPALSRRDPIHWTVTPGAFRLSVGDSNIPTLRVDGNNRNFVNNDDTEAVSDTSNGNNQSPSEHRERSPTLHQQLLSQHHQWSFRTMPLEARLVTASNRNDNYWNESDISSPTEVPVATVSKEIVVAEVVDFSQKHILIPSIDRRYSRLIWSFTVAIFAVGIVSLSIVLSKKKSGDLDRMSIDSFHAVLFGESSSCSKLLQLTCGGMKVIDDDRAEIELFYSNSTSCSKTGSNSAICILDSNTSYPYKPVHGGVGFHCRRRDYVDDSNIVASAIFRNSGCTSKTWNSDKGHDDTFDKNSVDNFSYNNNATNSSLDVAQYMGLGHFCQFRRDGDITWLLMPNKVVTDGVVLEGCITPNATFTDSNDTKLSYCSIPANPSCSGNKLECKSLPTEISIVDTFTKCQDTREMNASLNQMISYMLNDAISESKSLFL